MGLLNVFMFKIEDFGVKKKDIKVDLTNYINYLENYINSGRTSKTKNNFFKQFDTVDDYIFILYYLKFDQKLNYAEIGNKLYPEVKSNFFKVFSEYSNLGLNYSGNFNECKEAFFANLQKLNILKEKSYTIDLNSFNLSEFQYTEYYELLEKFIVSLTKKRVTELCLKLGFTTPEDYFKTLYYYTRICKLSSLEIAIILNLTASGSQSRLRALGLTMDRETAQKNANRNYTNTIHTGRNTMNNAIIKTGAFGSNIENVVRNKFAMYLSTHINKDNYEVVVGINNQTIIAPKEIDIPIIIIDISKNIFFKFAIEFNGYCFHEDPKREEIKIEELKSKNWTCYTIWQLSNTKKQREFGEIKQQIIEICSEIKKIIYLV
jgi:hypothetical protein